MDFNDPKEFDDPQLFDDQLEVWTLIIQKSTVIPPSPMVLFYETQVPSLSTLVTHYLTNSLTNVVEA